MDCGENGVYLPLSGGPNIPMKFGNVRSHGISPTRIARQTSEMIRKTAVWNLNTSRMSRQMREFQEAQDKGILEFWLSFCVNLSGISSSGPIESATAPAAVAIR